MAWKLHAIEQMQLRGRRRVDSVGRPKFDFHTASRQHWGMENHFNGRAALTSPVAKFVKFSTILAKDGVISGRKVTLAPSLSVKQYICWLISSPAFLSYNSTCSKTGASYSLKPNSFAVCLMWSNNQFLTFISAGSKSRVPEGGSNQKGLGTSSCGASAAALSSAFFILSFFMVESLIRSTTFLRSESLPFFSAAFFSFKAAASAAVGLDFGFSTVRLRHSRTSSGLSRAPISGPPRGIVGVLRGCGCGEARLLTRRCGCRSRQSCAVRCAASIEMSMRR